MDAVVCGIDPALGTTGYAILRCLDEALTVVDAGVCRSDERAPLPRRLIAIEGDIASVFDEHEPDVVAVEDLYSHYRHPKTAVLMGHVRGVILSSAARAGIDVRSYAATRIKRFLTGNGRATKAQMQRAVQTALGLASMPEPSDVADALAIAMCCAAEMRNPIHAEVLP
ncbi:MAG: crossover junction endodeoxyribonuclease RuvC [Planctomycetota bacterium]|jgi:crossover junction endodeoxyribonuclease RuvC